MMFDTETAKDVFGGCLYYNTHTFIFLSFVHCIYMKQQSRLPLSMVGINGLYPLLTRVSVLVGDVANKRAKAAMLSLSYNSSYIYPYHFYRHRKSEHHLGIKASCCFKYPNG